MIDNVFHILFACSLIANDEKEKKKKKKKIRKIIAIAKLYMYFVI